MSQVSNLINDGYVIINAWPLEVHSITSATMRFRMGKGHDRVLVDEFTQIDMPHDLEIPNIGVRRGNHCYELVHNQKSFMGISRAMSIMGIGPFSSPGPGVKPALLPSGIRVAALDLEVKIDVKFGNSLPSPLSTLVSISVVSAICDDLIKGTMHSVSKRVLFVDGVYDSDRLSQMDICATRCSDQAEMIQMLHEILIDADPDFILAHNGYGFDYRFLFVNTALSANLGPQYKNFSISTSVDEGLWVSPRGAVMADTYYYLNKTSRFSFTSLSLGSLSSSLGLSPKLDLPLDLLKMSTIADEDITDLLVYNVQDSMIVLELFLHPKTQIGIKIMTITGSSRSTLWDGVFNNTGTLVFCLQASHAASKGMIHDVGLTPYTITTEKYKGGNVYEPTPAKLRTVCSIDGNGLYANIQRLLWIHIDNCAAYFDINELACVMGTSSYPDPHHLVEDEPIVVDGLVWLKVSGMFIALRPKSGSGITGEIMTMLVELRASSVDAGQKWSWKILTLSAYGSCGSSHGNLSSKAVASMITAIARKYQREMERLALQHGFRVVYGDTDSVFISLDHHNKPKGHKQGDGGPRAASPCNRQVDETEEMDDLLTRANEMVAGLDASVKNTYMEGLTSKVESVCHTIVLCSMKKYYYRKYNDPHLEDVVYKGVVAARKDAPPVVERAFRTLSSYCLRDGVTPELIYSRCFKMCKRIYDEVSMGEVDLVLYGDRAKVDGVEGLSYRTRGGHMVFMPEFGSGVKVEVDAAWVLDRVLGAICPTLQACCGKTMSSSLFVVTDHCV